MAVSDEFKEMWLECQEEYSRNIESGDVPVMSLNEIDATVSLPAVKFTKAFDPSPGAKNVPEGYRHVPMQTFMQPIDDAVDAAEAAAAAANQAAGSVSTALQRADQDHSRAETDHSASVSATAGAERVNAQIEGMTVTITNRQGTSSSVNIGFEVYRTYGSVVAMNADAANVPAGKFVMIATTDPTDPDNAKLYGKNANGSFSFLSDLDQASSAAWADWLNNYKPVIEGDHTRAESDHSTAATDHSTATADHTQAGSDHNRAATDHTTATADHTQAGTDHNRAETDHSTASGDHTQAGTDHSRAEDDHSTAATDHTTADTDHSTAVRDHSTANSDHSRAATDHATATTDHAAAVEATAFANQQGNRAKAFNDNPWEIRSDGYIWVWDETHDNGDGTYGAMVRTNKMIIDFSDLTPEQQAAMVQEFLSHLAFDETPTAGSTNPVTSRGIKTALDTKQDTLSFATVAESQAAAQELT